MPVKRNELAAQGRLKCMILQMYSIKSTQYNALFAHKYMYMYGKGIGECFKFMIMVAWRDHGGRTGEKAMSIRLCSFHFNSVRNAASSEGRALGTCSVGMVGEREHLL